MYLHFIVGESERVLHQLFDDAKKTKPSVIFLDELDALVRVWRRTHVVLGGGGATYKWVIRPV